MMTPQQRLDHLLADVWQPTNRAVVFADITEVVGMEATVLVVGTMKAGSAANPLLDTVIIAMSTNGLSLSTPERQAVIDMLATAGQWPDAVRDAVKALGGVYVKEWQRQGMVVEPTLESVQAEIDAENLATLRSDLQARFDAIKNQIGTVEQSEAVAALRAMADELAVM